MLEAFAKSDAGKELWFTHKELGVRLAETQAKMTPLQRRFLLLADKEHGPDNNDIPNQNSVSY